MKVSELLCAPEKWTQGANARDEHGQDLEGDEYEAVCWCLEGACFRCYSDDWLEPLVRIERLLGVASVNKWNDATDRTFEDIRALVLELDL